LQHVFPIRNYTPRRLHELQVRWYTEWADQRKEMGLTNPSKWPMEVPECRCPQSLPEQKQLFS
jgi:hypothetical protein